MEDLTWEQQRLALIKWVAWYGRYFNQRLFAEERLKGTMDSLHEVLNGFSQIQQQAFFLSRSEEGMDLVTEANAMYLELTVARYSGHIVRVSNALFRKLSELQDKL